MKYKETERKVKDEPFFSFLSREGKHMRKTGMKMKRSRLDVDGRKVQFEDRHYFILMVLLKDRPMSLDELEERAIIFVNQVGSPSWFYDHEKPEHRGDIDLRKGCEELKKSGNIVLRKEKRYALTKEGRKLAEKVSKELERGAYFVNRALRAFLNPDIAARITIAVDFFLAAIKLTAGFITGSVALLADGADAAVDTASAFVVWLGIRLDKELVGTVVIILMMLVASVSIGYESIIGIVGAIRGNLEPMGTPLLVIAVESIALVSAVFLYFYQNYTGKRVGSLSLISQSVDSKNHIYVAGAVIMGAAFSMFGIYFVDSLIGAFVAVKIFLDAIGLTREALSQAQGEETDFSKYKTIVDDKWDQYRLDSFRSWILYLLRDGGETKEGLLDSLNKTYKPEYVPIMSEFNFGIGRGFDFEGEFENLINPLIEKKLLSREGEKFSLSGKGRDKIRAMVRMLRFRGG